MMHKRLKVAISVAATIENPDCLGKSRCRNEEIQNRFWRMMLALMSKVARHKVSIPSTLSADIVDCHSGRIVFSDMTNAFESPAGQTLLCQSKIIIPLALGINNGLCVARLAHSVQSVRLFPLSILLLLLIADSL